MTNLETSLIALLVEADLAEIYERAWEEVSRSPNSPLIHIAWAFSSSLCRCAGYIENVDRACGSVPCTAI